MSNHLLVTPGPNSMFKSKLDIARHIMKFSNGKMKDELISELVHEAGCGTVACANTYYYKLKKELDL